MCNIDEDNTLAVIQGCFNITYYYYRQSIVGIQYGQECYALALYEKNILNCNVVQSNVELQEKIEEFKTKVIVKEIKACQKML